MTGIRPINIPPLQLKAPDPWKGLDDDLADFPDLYRVPVEGSKRWQAEWSEVKKNFGQKVGVYRFAEGRLE